MNLDMKEIQILVKFCGFLCSMYKLVTLPPKNSGADRAKNQKLLRIGKVILQFQ